MAGDWYRMVLTEARQEAEGLADQARRTVAEYHANGNTQAYQDGLLALTARIKALPAEQAGMVIADLCGMLAWGPRP